MGAVHHAGCNCPMCFFAYEDRERQIAEKFGSVEPAEELRVMRSTELLTTPLDDIAPGLRIVEKFHPSSEKFPDPSYEVIAGLKGRHGSISLRPKGGI